MKRYLFIAATAAMTLASCTEQVDFTQESLQSKNDAPTAVQFGTYMGKTGTTRAGTNGAITTDALKTGTHKNDGFGVFAYNTGAAEWASATSATPNFMYNQQVKWDASVAPAAWTYTPLKYWPNDNQTADNNNATGSQTHSYLSFFAYAPYTDKVTVSSTEYNLDPATGWFKDGSSKEYVATANTEAFGILSMTSNSTAGDPKITYRFKQTSGTYDLSAANNVDLLWGVRSAGTYKEADGSDNTTTVETYNVNLTKQYTNEKVNFFFKHALAKLGGSDGINSGIQVVADFDANETTNPATAGAGNKGATTLITLNSIKFENGTTGDPAVSTLKAGGVFDLATGTWDTSNATTSPAMTFLNNYTTGNSVVWEPTPVPTYTSNAWSMTGVTTTPTNVFSSATDPLYFIPAAGASLKVTVQYTVRTYDPNLATPSGEYATCSKIMQTITNSVDISALEPNKYYKIIIHLGLTSVKFEASVSDWEDATSGSSSSATVIWLPSNVVPSSGS